MRTDRPALVASFALAATLACGRGSKTEPTGEPVVGAAPVAAAAARTSLVRDSHELKYIGEHDVPDATFVAMSAEGPCAVTAEGDVWCRTEPGSWDKRAWNAGPGVREIVSQRPGKRICVVTTAGELRCDFAHGLRERAIAQVALPHTLEHETTCVLGQDGDIRCVGGGPMASPPQGKFRELACTYELCCALGRDAGATCWGEAAVDGPPTKLRRLSVTGNGSCALDDEGSARCWGQFEPKGHVGPFVDLFVGVTSACGVAADGGSRCWFIATGDPDGLPPVHVRAAATRYHDGCVLDAVGHVQCWGTKRFGPIPSGRFTKLSGQAGVVCGIREDGEVVCWGSKGAITATVPPGSFKQVDVGPARACGVTSAKTVACWGKTGPDAPPPPGGQFESVVVGYRPCALDATGHATCWGSGKGLGGTFVQLAAGSAYTCGLRPNGSIECLVGDEFFVGRTDSTPPPGFTMVALATGYEHACGLDVDGVARCWGRDVGEETHPPSDKRFTKLALAEKRSCGLERSGAITCWGASPGAAPVGEFVDLALTGDTDPDSDPAYVCAIKKADRTVICWPY